MLVSRATLRVQWSSRLDLTLVRSGPRDFGTPAFALSERFCRGCWLRAEGFQRRARAWCRTGGKALGHTPRSCVFTHPLPRRFRVRCCCCCFRCQRNPERKFGNSSARLEYATCSSLRFCCRQVWMCSDHPLIKTGAFLNLISITESR